VGFVCNLHCESCDFVKRHVTIGLSGGGGSTLALTQDQQSGAIRQIAVTNRDIEGHSGQTEFESEDVWLAALFACVESHLTDTERNIAPHEAFCPKCRVPLRIEDVGIS